MSHDTLTPPLTAAERFLALSRVGSALMSELDEKRLLDLIAHTACDLTGATFAAFFLRPIAEDGQPQVRAEGSLFHLAAVFGVTSEQEALLRRMPLGEEGLLAPIFRHGVPVLVADALTHLPAASHSPLSNEGTEEAAPDFAQGRLPMRSFLGAPLLDGAGKVRGGLLLGHTKPDQFMEQDQAILLILAGQAAVALEKSRLHQLAQLQARRTSYLEATFEAMVDGVYVYDQQGGIVQLNSTARTLLARVEQPGSEVLPVDERIGEAVAVDAEGERLTPEQWPLKRMLQGEQFTPERAIELRLQTRDGAVVHVNVTGGPIRDAHGQIIGAVAISHDVTERKKAEQSLLKAERQAQEYASQLEAIFEAIPDGIIITDAKGQHLQVNTATRTLFGLQDRPEALVGSIQTLAQALQLRDENEQVRPKEQVAIARLLSGETLSHSNPSIAFIHTLDGHTRYLSTTGAPLYDEDGHIIGAVCVSRDITEQKQVQHQIQEQAQQLSLQASLIAMAHDAIIVRDPESVIISWNQGAEALYGWPAQEAIGQVTHTLLQTHFPLSQEVVQHLLELEGEWEGELVHTRRDGQTVIVESRQVVVRDATGRASAILEINRDITTRRHLEQREREAHAAAESRLSLLQLILDELPSCIYLVRGPEARLVLANRAVSTIYGDTWTPGQPLREFFAQQRVRIMRPDGRPLEPEQLPALRVVQLGETVRQFQQVIRHADETALPVLVNAVPVDVASLLGGIAQTTFDPAEPERAALVVCQDVTALKEAEALKDEFLTIASHELRGPLAVLRGYADMLLRQDARGRGVPLATWQQEGLQEITVAVSRLTHLTEDLLNVARLQEERHNLTCEPTNLATIAERVVKQQQVTTQRHQLTLHKAHERLVVNMDPGRLEQVLTNLLNNAIKYSPQGGSIEISIEARKVAEGGEAEEVAEAVISICDHGMGIPAEQHARIFGRFVRAENARTSEIVGTGLGLYLCRELVEHYGGHIWFESSKDVGSTFFVAFPVNAKVLL